MTLEKIPLRGTKRTPLAGAVATSEIDPNKHIEVTVVLKPSNSLANEVREMYKVPLSERVPLSHQEYEQKYSVSDEDIDKVRKFAHENGLEVKEINKAGRSLRLSGSISSMNKAFNVTLRHYETPKGSYRGREGEIFVPSTLKDIVFTVLGLDNRPIYRPHYRRVNKVHNQDGENNGPDISYYPTDLNGIYNIPTNVDGRGQTIGLIELGGGRGPNSGYHPEDINTYFQQIGVTPPILKDISVDGGTNSPDGPDVNGISNGDGEVILDIEVAGAIAPGANIFVYFAPLSDDGFRDAVNMAINGDANGQNNLPPGSVLSISWGAAEINQQEQLIIDMDHLFTAAAAKNITVCAAAGDDGTNDRVNDGSYHVDFPASSPMVLACGGTRLAQDSVNTEVVWNEISNGHGATGGGISRVFDIDGTDPIKSHAYYQSNTNIPLSPDGKRMRGVPDVAGNADPLTGYKIFINGKDDTIGGTSAVAPLFAGLISLLNKSLGKGVGFINPYIYENLEIRKTFKDITLGNNNTNGGIMYQAGEGWDACTGWGSPNGMALLNALKLS